MGLPRSCRLPRSSHILLSALCVVGLLGHDSLVWGQEIAPKAERLFDEGLKLAQGGDCTLARDKFVESYAADPAPGTLINWALCEEKLGRPAAALDLLRIADQKLTPNHPKHPGVTKHIESLIKRVPFLRLRVSSEWPAGTVVLKDGAVIDEAALGQSHPHDPGPHVIVVRAPGRQDRHYDISLMEGRTLELTLEAGASLPLDGVSAPADAKPAERAQSQDRMMGLVIAGGGLAAIVTGTVTGLLAQARWHDVQNLCDLETKKCPQEGLDASQAGNTLSTISTASFVTGAVALGLGGYFIFKDGSPRPASSGPQPVVIAGPHEWGLRLRGSF